MNASPPGDFFHSTAAEPHRGRTQAILRAHPEVRTLFGRNPWTGAVLLGLVLGQTAIAGWLGALGLGHWWLAALVAYAVGACANHCLYVVTHEACHNLIFRSRWLNRLAGLAADLPNLFPGAMGFSVYHLKHHAHQGEYEIDGDLPSRWEARLVGNRWYAKALWLACMPIVLMLRPGRIGVGPMLNGWWLANVVTVVAYDVAVWVWLGPNALLYLLGSFFFSIGLHPLGARWIQEHYTCDPAQETMSYYGPANWLTMNVGYHNEHHDFPSIPWNRLPRLRALAPEFYDSLRSERSYWRLLVEFIFSPRYTLFSRVERPGRAD